VTASHPACSELKLCLEVFVRSQRPDGTRLVTVCAINRTPKPTQPDRYSIFQSALEVEAIAADGAALVCPYPQSTEVLDEEEEGLALIYRKVETYAVGHGCAADWGPVYWNGRVSSVRGVALPAYEAPSITPDLWDAHMGLLTVSMAKLAALDSAGDGQQDLQELVARYEAWIADLKAEASTLPTRHAAAAARHILACERAAKRMREGLAYLAGSADARLAFRLANHAMLLQQLAGAGPKRPSQIGATGLQFGAHYSAPDPAKASPRQGQWRPFQIAFLLMALRSAAEDDAPDRDTVELIWFPTGGGKTEAYLGLAAFSMIMRRLRDPADAGTSVLMRYTLRLLTAQQFQRACRLICAMEVLRRKQPGQLGKMPFSIGIWVGVKTTPNKHKGAMHAYKELCKNWGASSPFLLSECPWCKASFGQAILQEGVPKPKKPLVVGLEDRGNRVVFSCPDSRCDFSQDLPVHVVDEDVYAVRPTFLLGTVDKFAMLAWLPEARSLFGRDASGLRSASPPGLIIQDELHLISGPLGSMVGLYEAVIEELCTDRRHGKRTRPKLVCSTATIRRYPDQIRALYGRADACLFPPPGLDAADSFFSQYARDRETGALLPGRMYVGIHAPGLRSLQTAQVRTFAALMQAPVDLAPAERDPWWTLLVFFNSLRELGSTLTLVQSDIPDYLVGLARRCGITWQQLRRLRNIEELTSRLKDDEVSQAIDKLERAAERTDSIDLCLASSIIEVGVDIDRLSLMSIVGMPKSTSQYIQVSGRVGRRWEERPGLVATIFSASKARDKSHFEHFRTYHERLYAQVEPSSVTPFALPVLERALHAALAVFVRQQLPMSAADRPSPQPVALLADARTLLEDRVAAAEDPSRVQISKAVLLSVMQKRLDEWQQWQPRSWSDNSGGDIPLLRNAGNYASPAEQARSWATPMSMRNVDAECQLIISSLLADEGVSSDV
jgi:hypothetical protein